MATTTKRTRFSRRLPDHVTDELCVVLAEFINSVASFWQFALLADTSDC